MTFNYGAQCMTGAKIAIKLLLGLRAFAGPFYECRGLQSTVYQISQSGFDRGLIHDHNYIHNEGLGARSADQQFCGGATGGGLCIGL